MKTPEKVEYHVQMTSDRSNGASSWAVAEHLFDGDPSGKPRVTYLSTHAWRSEAIKAAQQLAGDATYYVDDAPCPSTHFSPAEIAAFFGA